MLSSFNSSSLSSPFITSLELEIPLRSAWLLILLSLSFNQILASTSYQIHEHVIHMPHPWRSWVIYLSLAQGFTLGHLWWTLQCLLPGMGLFFLWLLSCSRIAKGHSCWAAAGHQWAPRADSKSHYGIRDLLAFFSSLSSILSVSPSFL